MEANNARLNGEALTDMTSADGRPAGEASPLSVEDSECLSPEICDQFAANLRELSGVWPIVVGVTGAIQDGIHPDVFKSYRSKLLADSGGPTDPIEVLLIEQIAAASFHIGRLQQRSCTTTNPKLVIALADSATRLLGEFRRSVLALEDYRIKQTTRKHAACTGKAVSPPTSATNGKPVDQNEPKRNGHSTEVPSNLHGKIPACLQERMRNQIPAESLPVAAIAGNGEA